MKRSSLALVGLLFACAQAPATLDTGTAFAQVWLHFDS